MSFEPHSDDVLSVTSPGLTPVNNQTLRVSQLVDAFKTLQSSTYRTLSIAKISEPFLDKAFTL